MPHQSFTHNMSLQHSNIRKSQNWIIGREISYVATARVAVEIWCCLVFIKSLLKETVTSRHWVRSIPWCDTLWWRSIIREEGKFLGVRRIFGGIFPNSPEKFLCDYPLPEHFWDELQKKAFMLFCKQWTPISARIFKYLSQIFWDFTDFQGFCQDFLQIKTFGGVLTPPPPTPLCSMTTIWVKRWFVGRMTGCLLYLVFHRRAAHRLL